jgi:hypothetical protein
MMAWIQSIIKSLQPKSDSYFVKTKHPNGQVTIDVSEFWGLGKNSDFEAFHQKRVAERRAARAADVKLRDGVKG